MFHNTEKTETCHGNVLQAGTDLRIGQIGRGPAQLFL